MCDFDEKYQKYLKENAEAIKQKIQNEEREFHSEFRCSAPDKDFVFKMVFPFFVGIIFLYFMRGYLGTPAGRFVSTVVLLALVIWSCVQGSNCRRDITDYLFYKCEKKKIVGDFVRRDAQRQAEKLIEEMLNVEGSDLDVVAHVETYKIKLRETNEFYYRCLEEIEKRDFMFM